MCEREDATVLKLRGEAVKRVLDIPDMIDYVNSFAELESDPGPYDDVDYSKVVASFNQDPWLLIYTILGAWA